MGILVEIILATMVIVMILSYILHIMLAFDNKNNGLKVILCLSNCFVVFYELYKPNMGDPEKIEFEAPFFYEKAGRSWSPFHVEIPKEDGIGGVSVIIDPFTYPLYFTFLFVSIIHSNRYEIKKSLNFIFLNKRALKKAKRALYDFAKLFSITLSKRA